MDDHLEASGTVSMIRAAADSAVLIGWFNSETHIGAPPINFIGVMIEGPSQIGHYFRPIYANSKDANGDQLLERMQIDMIRHWSIIQEQIVEQEILL